jgi:hypothetical protein
MADEQRVYQDPVQAQLGERVTNLGRRQTDLEAEMRSGFRQIEQSFASFTNETRQAIASLGTSMSERSRPQWQALGVMVSVIVVLGGLVYWPIRESTNDLKDQDKETSRLIQSLTSETAKSLQALAANTVSRQEMDWRAARGVEDRNTMQTAIADIRAGLVPRAEHERVWANFDQRFSDEQRQIDELKASSASTYNVRDFIMDLRNRLDALERTKPPPS